MGSKSLTRVLGGIVCLLAFYFSALPVESGLVSPGIHAELKTGKLLCLHVTLQSGAESPVMVYRSRLPWGNKYSMILVAVLPGGRNLKKELTIDDPSPVQISLAPKEVVSGDIDLQSVFKGLKHALKTSDVHLFWAYEAPEELHIPRWSGGWILIPKQE